jgi:hypothetical protein
MRVIAWLKTALGIVGIGVVVALLTALAVSIVRFNRKRLHILRAAAAASTENLEAIYRRVEACGTEEHAGYVLAWTNEAVGDKSSIVEIPRDFVGFPWAGRAVAPFLQPRQPLQFRFVASTGCGTRLSGRKFRPVRVPRIRLASGKERNQFDPRKYLKDDPALRQELCKVCAEYPEELLAQLLCVGRESYEFDPIDQARIGTSAAWIQGPEHPSCDQCGKKMRLIVQIPGALVDEDTYGGTFYFFGCEKHPDRTATVAQSS